MYLVRIGAGWASHDGEEALKTRVSYMEVTTSDEILKQINIIDTPGLDSTNKVDSENTKQFLKQVNPDAVIFLFTKSLSEDSLNLIKEFQMSGIGNSYSVTPLNSLGVLSKPDLNWSVLNRGDVINACSSAISRTLSSREDVKKSLFRILPVSALMGLSSACITEEDYFEFKSLSEIQDEKKIMRLFVNTDAFLRNAEIVKIPSLQAKRLQEKFGLYGIFVCMETLRSSPNISKEQLSTVLRAKSGFVEFLTLLKSHFGDRAAILKAQRGVLSLIDACDRDRQEANEPNVIDLIDKIKRCITNIENEFHDIKEISLLMSIYEGKFKVADSFFDELKRVCGEQGYGIIDRLEASTDTPVSQLVSIAKEKYAYWERKYNSIRYLSEPKAYPYEVLAKSYLLIAERLITQQKAYKQALQTIGIYNRYIYGKDKI